MSAQDNLSQELFRGLMSPKVKQPLGIHWSSVEGLAGESKGMGASLFANPAPGEKHSIVSAKVDSENVVNGYDQEFYKKHDIFGGGHPEYEEPVYPGSRVEVNKVTSVRNVGGKVKTRERRYTQPREMQA